MDARRGTKKLNLLAYRLFAKWRVYNFDVPRVTDTEAQLPFIVTEAELDSLIAGSGHTLSAYLQTWKESGARCGKLAKAEWTGLDIQSGIFNISLDRVISEAFCGVVVYHSDCLHERVADSWTHESEASLA